MSIKHSLTKTGKVLLMALGVLFIVGVVNITIEQPNPDNAASQIAEEYNEKAPIEFNNGRGTIVGAQANGDVVVVETQTTDRPTNEQGYMIGVEAGLEQSYCSNRTEFEQLDIKIQAIVSYQDGQQIGKTDVIGPEDC